MPPRRTSTYDEAKLRELPRATRWPARATRSARLPAGTAHRSPPSMWSTSVLPRPINVTHRSPAVLGRDGIRRQDEHERVLEARRLAARVDAATPPAPPRTPRGADEAALGSGATAAGGPSSLSPGPASAPQGGSPRLTATPWKVPTVVIEVGKARERQVERRARLADLDRIDAALGRALAEQPYFGRS